MTWCLALRQGQSIADLTPFVTGSLEQVIRLAADCFGLLTASQHIDGRWYGGEWHAGYNGDPLPYAIVLLGMLPADRRGGRS